VHDASPGGTRPAAPAGYRRDVHSVHQLFRPDVVADPERSTGRQSVSCHRCVLGRGAARPGIAAPWEQTILDQGHHPQDAAEALMRAVLGEHGWPATPERIGNQRRAEAPILVEETRSRSETGPSFDPEALACPVIVAAGGASLDHHRLVSRRLADLLPRGVYHELADAGHPAHMTHPEPFAGLVIEAGHAARR
jgi:pimeloyl-ACP methyl ester carboxylesterase